MRKCKTKDETNVFKHFLTLIKPILMGELARTVLTLRSDDQSQKALATQDLRFAAMGGNNIGEAVPALLKLLTEENGAIAKANAAEALAYHFLGTEHFVEIEAMMKNGDAPTKNGVLNAFRTSLDMGREISHAMTIVFHALGNKDDNVRKKAKEMAKDFTAECEDIPLLDNLQRIADIGCTPESISIGDEIFARKAKLKSAGKEYDPFAHDDRREPDRPITSAVKSAVRPATIKPPERPPEKRGLLKRLLSR